MGNQGGSRVLDSCSSVNRRAYIDLASPGPSKHLLGRHRSVVSLALLGMQGSDSPWYPIGKAFDFTADPPYVHRVFFVLIARFAQSLTGMSVLHSFFVSQFVALLLAMTAVWKLAEIFIGNRQAFLAPVVLSAILAPTFTYFTFYDIGIVFFYAACLYMLFQGRWLHYLVFFTLGVFNHENILLMIPVSAVIYFGRKKWLLFLAAQFSLYIGARALLFHLIPVSRAWDQGKIWYNINLFLFHPGAFDKTIILFLWFTLGVCLAGRATLQLKQSIILLPMLLGVTILAGQMNEAGNSTRLFRLPSF